MNNFCCISSFLVPKKNFLSLNGQYTYETQNCKKKHRSHKNGFFEEGMLYLFYHQRNKLRYVQYFALELYNFLKQKFKWLKKKPHRIQSSDKAAVVVAVSTHQGST